MKPYNIRVEDALSSVDDEYNDKLDNDETIRNHRSQNNDKNTNDVNRIYDDIENDNWVITAVIIAVILRDWNDDNGKRDATAK